MNTPHAPSRLLRLDASVRTEGSYTRRLADAVEARWRQAHPQGEVLRRDLARQPPPAVTEATTLGFYTPAGQLTSELRQALACSDELVAQLRAADTLLVATPMYNFGPPSALKAWIDQVVRVGHTFQYGPDGPQGLLQTRLAVLALASGVPGSLGGGADFMAPYLEGLLKFLGVQQVVTLKVDGTAGPAARVEAAVADAQRQAQALFG